MRRLNKKAIIEFSLYFSILVVGVVLIAISYYQTDFVQDLLLNLGSNMTVITIVFLISKIFSERSKVPPELQGKLSDMASPSPGSVERKYHEGDSGNK